MKVSCIWEHNGNDSLLYADGFAGAYARGASREEALGKMRGEIPAYLLWRDGTALPPGEAVEPVISGEKASGLPIADADTDVLFLSEKPPLTRAEYDTLRDLCLRSARDFQRLFDAVPDKDRTVLPCRQTFYGPVPVTARQMYAHARGVNGYYFGALGFDADAAGAIAACRERAFRALERTGDYLENRLRVDRDGESWTLRKVCRRFVWHDRIHAKAMFRMACRTFGAGSVPDVFRFSAQPGFRL